jgi:hypothetical protein
MKNVCIGAFSYFADSYKNKAKEVVVSASVVGGKCLVGGHKVEGTCLLPSWAAC